MSSLLRRIQRQVSPSHPVWHVDLDGKKSKVINPPRKKFYAGRGSKLGVKNPRDACITGKRKAPMVWRGKANAPAPKKHLPHGSLAQPRVRLTRAQRRADHAVKMAEKRGTCWPQILLMRGDPASINYHTRNPHEHKRESARRLRQRKEG